MKGPKVDANHGSIRDALRDIPGVVVVDLSAIGRGMPDMAVGYRGINYFLEAKTPKGKLNPRQIKWHKSWTGQVAIVTTLDEALAVLGIAT